MHGTWAGFHHLDISSAGLEVDAYQRGSQEPASPPPHLQVREGYLDQALGLLDRILLGSALNISEALVLALSSPFRLVTSLSILHLSLLLSNYPSSHDVDHLGFRV